MVMHARKHPRLDDGYADKNEARPIQSSQYPSKQYRYADKYRGQRSPGGRTSSPGSRESPRHINKTSHIERAKDKYERGNTESPDKKVNHSGSYPGTSNHSNNGHPNSESRTPAKSSGNPKDPKEIQKTAVRICGDWSEHISSSQKCYYYNCKTEVSQWEKPRDWVDGACKPGRQSIDSRVTNDRQNAKEIKNRHASGPEKREKHLGDLRHMVADGNPKPDKKYLFEKLQQSQSQLQAELRANATNKSHSVEHRRTSDALSSSLSSTDYNSSRRSRRDSDGPNGSRTLNRQGTRNDANEDMDISPDSTPTSLRSSNCAATPQIPNSTPGSYNLNALASTGSISSASELNISSIPGLINQLSGGKNNQELTNKALETLQKLQEALTKQIAAHQTSVANQTLSSSSVSTSSRQPPPQYQQHLASAQHSHVDERVPVHPHPANLSASYPLNRSPFIPSHNSLPPQSSPSTQTYSSLQHQHSSPPIILGTGVGASAPISQPQVCSPAFSQTKMNTVYGKLRGSQEQNAQQDINLIDDRGGGGMGGESPVSNHGGSDRSSCCSPAPSETSSQDQEVDPDMFTATTNMKRETSVMAKVAQYYNPNLVGHVTGWQGDIAERQAQHFHDDSLRVNSLICGQTSVELKRARSLVRVQEIQATLHEQRNLFLAQQIQELENMKPVSSFLSSS